MDLKIRFGTHGLDWHVVSDIFRRAPLGEREPEKLRRAAENSYAVCSAWDGDIMIAFARATCDGEYQAAIYDVVVLPEYQGRGVGGEMIEAIKSYLPSLKTIMLFANPGKETFYAKFGFRRLKTGMAIFANEDLARQSGYIE